MSTSPEPLEEVVAEAVQRFRKRLPDSKVDVKVPDEFLMVPMDATLIEQVIINLLENAVYHSGTDEPIEFYVEKRDGYVAFHIRDYGKGIDPERRKQFLTEQESNLMLAEIPTKEWESDLPSARPLSMRITEPLRRQTA